MITFSLVLEHIQNLDHIFNEASNVLAKGGHLYIGELHPFKQYTGTKARFETEKGLQIADCYNHNISEFTQAAKKHGFAIVDLNEYFDEGDNTTLPRILTLFLQKK
jgi:ubiquinone/menaquinone biosynthesis C-methylase UbiE